MATRKPQHPNNRQTQQRKSQQKLAMQVAGATIVVAIAGKLVMRLFKPGENKSEFKFLLNLQPTEIIKLAENVIVKSQKILDAIAAISLDQVTYGSVIAPLARLEAEEFALVQSCKFPRLISTSKEIRQASIDAEKMLDAYKQKSSMRTDVYRVVKAFSQKNTGLDAEAQRFVAHLVRDYERQGLHLTQELREETERLKARISELCSVFQNNLNEDESFVRVTTEELSGMPPEFIKSLEGGDDGRVNITLKSYHYFPIMEQCKVRKTRTSVATARYQRCMKENVPIFEKVLELRRKLAKLLGYRNWAEYCMEIRMAKRTEKVLEFHERMLQNIIPVAQKELKLLQDLKEEEDGEPIIGLEDILYYIGKAERRLLNFDMNELNHYLVLDKVTSGMFRIYEQLLGLRFQELNGKYVWHEDVKDYSVLDSETGDVLGFFYLDLYTREGKYNHTCVVPLQPYYDYGNGKKQLPVAALLMSFTKTTSNGPRFLKHSEFVKYFHEFGHMMHHICSRARFARFSGLLVEPDFLEVPSNMLEYWCYEKDALKLIIGPSESIKAATLDKLCNVLKEKRRSFLALKTLRNHLFVGIFDYIIHTEEKIDTEQLIKKLYPEVVLGMPIAEGTNLAASTLHLLAGGCDAVCYTYLWSEVFAADMFEARFKGNMMSNSAGMEYRNKVLAPGASKDAFQILRDFLGRDPSPEAYLRLNGLNQFTEM